jgi:mannose-6-phosphate isomerase
MTALRAAPALVALDPFLLSTVWGGSALQTRFGKRFSASEPLGETWEVSCIHGRFSATEDGFRLVDLVRAEPGRFGGVGADGALPLLVKLLATSQVLSVQVHPDDDAARRFEGGGAGKHEAWVVLDAAPGAELFLGLKEGATTGDLCDAAVRGDADGVRACLRRVLPRAGDVFDLAPGTVHAPGAGLVLYEVQQPSDLTYRLFDWNRVGLDGKPRTLHVDKARAVIVPGLRPDSRVAPPASGTAILLDTPHFVLRRHGGSGDGGRVFGRPDYVTCVAGTGRICADGASPVDLAPGRTCAVLADAKNVRIDGPGLDLLIASPAR